MNCLRPLLILCLLLPAVVFGSVNQPGAPSGVEHSRKFREGVVIAKPRAEAGAVVEQAESAERLRVRQKFARFGGLRVIEVAAGESVADNVARLKATGRYEFVEPDYIAYPDAAPNDPSYSSQWAMANLGTAAGSVYGADIRAQMAWDIIHDAPNVIIAVVDSGVRTDHKDIAPNLWVNPTPTFGDVNGASFLDGTRTGTIEDTYGHGTHVAGIVCAAGNNGVATAGVVWKTQLMVLKNMRDDGGASMSDSAACIDYAVAHGAKVINCSWGSSTYSMTLFTAIKAARDAGVVVVCSAGNDGTNNDIYPHYPSNYLLDNVVAVGNSTPSDTWATSSDWGNSVDLLAPGTNIVSLDSRSTTGVKTASGTSMATPHVTGTLALLRASCPNDTYRQLINRLLRGTEYRPGLAGTCVTNGRLNLLRALDAPNTPFNDTFDDRAVITGGDFVIRANTSGARSQTRMGTNSLWWHWIAPAAGQYVIDTAGSECDTVVEVYTSTLGLPTQAQLVPLASNDDVNGGTSSRTTFAAQKGSYYYIALSSKGAAGPAVISLCAAPMNDHYSDAQTLSGQSVHATGSTRGATAEASEPKILSNTPTGSIWYRWTAPRSGRFQFSSFATDFDTLLAIYTGSTLQNLTLVGANDNTDAGTTIRNSDSRCTINAVAGTEYTIQIDTKNGTRGPVTVSITDSLWQFSTAADLTSTPAVAEDGTIYVAGDLPDYRLYAISKDGGLKWASSLDSSVSMGAPALAADGTIYQISTQGSVYAFSPTGARKWKQTLGTGLGTSSSIAIATDGTLYVHADDGMVYSLNPADGRINWKYDAGVYGLNFASPVVAADGTIYQANDQKLHAISASGQRKWTYDFGATTYATPALDAAGNIYFTAHSSPALISLTSAGIKRWSTSLAAGVCSASPALSADGTTVYVPGSDRKLYAMDATNGSIKWTYLCGQSIYAITPAVDAKGVVYVGAYDGKIYAINADGTLKRTWDTASRIRSSPTIAGTTLYVAGTDAKLYAFDIGAAVADGPWPQFRHDVRRTGRNTPDVLGFAVAPQAVTAIYGESATLTVSATGQGPLTYQWTKNGVAIVGATNSSFVIAKVTTASAGSYAVTVTGPQGSVTSSAAQLTVKVINPGRLSNLSIRTTAGTGDESLIVGVSVAKTTTLAKPLLIRAVGPTLASFGVAGVITDPVLSVTQAGKTAPFATNDGWRGDAEIKNIGTSVGAFALGASGADAALYRRLDPDGYTMLVCGKAGTGVVLVEVYDASATDSFTSDTPRLTNVSARTQVGTGDNILIAGFAVAGVTPKRLLIRAVGPTLAKFGVNGTLKDPKLEIYTAASVKIKENDNWGSDAALSVAATSVGAFALEPGSNDAALIVTLEAGAYSATVKGVSDGTGVALVEVYELPDL